MKEEILQTPKACSDEDFVLVKKYIQEFELDDRKLLQEEFLTLKDKNTLLGFGRIREFSEHSELCSLGIISSHRSKGLGKILTQALINKAKSPLYLVCIIPSYFEHFDFKQCHSYPSEIKEKLNYCTSFLIVEEKYMVMKKAN